MLAFAPATRRPSSDARSPNLTYARALSVPPRASEQIIASNPQLSAMGPQIRQMMQSEQFRNFLTNPESMRQMAAMRGMMGGAGGQAAFPPVGPRFSDLSGRKHLRALTVLPTFGSLGPLELPLLQVTLEPLPLPRQRATPSTCLAAAAAVLLLAAHPAAASLATCRCRRQSRWRRCRR